MSRTVKETIMEGPEGIFNKYEENSPDKIPKKENSMDSSIIVEYFPDIMEAVA